MKKGTLIKLGLALPVIAVIALIGTWVARRGSQRGPALIPLPARLETERGWFRLEPSSQIVTDEECRGAAELLARRLRVATGLPLPIAAAAQEPAGSIVLRVTPAAKPLPEGYRLSVGKNSVRIEATTPAGVFYGTQTLLQLLPPAALSAKKEDAAWKIRCVRIEDAPRFPWRGYLLDVARHFFTPEEIRQTIDVLALHKINTLQLHLTDDQGWRVEIKAFPRLTEVGAWRKGIGFELDPKASTAYGPDGRYGGFYTQADIRDLVAYAKARHIRLVPEIELPGHASAALSAYPEFSCFGGPYSTDLGAGIFGGVFCAGNDATFEFLETVLGEVMELFPGEYVHIGGDEVSKENWRKCPKCQQRMKQENLASERALQSYFVRRTEKFIHSRGRKLVGWSEIREGGLPERAVLMDWIGGGVEAARAGYEVVMTPNEFCYLDMYQTRNKQSEPRAAGGVITLGKVYGYEPLPAELASAEQSKILGTQGNLWTELVPNLKHAQYMTFPRLTALAEVAWSPREARNWPDFLKRWEQQAERLKAMGVQYRPPAKQDEE